MRVIVRRLFGRGRQRDTMCSCPKREEPMAQLSNYPSFNRLLAVLSESDRELLEPHFDTVEMPVKFECEHPDNPIEHVYFPESGIISTVNGGGDDQIEVGMTGREGVTGLPILLGSDSSPNRTYCAGCWARTTDESR